MAGRRVALKAKETYARAVRSSQPNTLMVVPVLGVKSGEVRSHEARLHRRRKTPEGCLEHFVVGIALQTAMFADVQW